MSMDGKITEFYFIRHAPVVKREGHVPPHDPDIDPGPHGVDALRAFLPKQANWHVTPLKRTSQTATLLNKNLAPLSVTPAVDLAEQFLGDWHDQPIDAVWEQLAPLPKHNWSFAPSHLVPPNGESFDQLYARVGTWFETMQAQQYNAPQVVISHSGTMRAILAHMMGLDAGRALAVKIPHFGCIHASLMDASAARHQGGAWQIHHIGPIT